MLKCGLNYLDQSSRSRAVETPIRFNFIANWSFGGIIPSVFHVVSLQRSLRNNSQMPIQSNDADGNRDPAELLKESEMPTIPDVPVIKVNLPPREKIDKEAENDKQKLGMAYVLPSALAAPVIVLTLSGYWLDGRFHKSPWFTLVGALLGMVSGFINMIRIANRLDK